MKVILTVPKKSSSFQKTIEYLYTRKHKRDVSILSQKNVGMCVVFTRLSGHTHASIGKFLWMMPL